MRKIILSLCIVFFMQNTFAQSFFGPESANNNNPAPASNKPASADSFKNSVRQMNQQMETNLNQQVKTVTPTPPSATPESPAFQNQQAGQPENPAESTGAYPAQATPASSYGTPSTQPGYAPSSAPQTQAPAANQPYTGFGTSNKPTNSGGSSTTNKSSGWGVKY